jgi:mannobiose 2-epimerase
MKRAALSRSMPKSFFASTVLIGAWLYIFASCTPRSYNSLHESSFVRAATLDWRTLNWRRDRNFWVSSMKHSTNFFKKYAWDESLGTFFSEIDANGKRTSGKIFVLALSRAIYGFAQTSLYAREESRDYISTAQRAANYMLTNMVATENINGADLPYFKEMIDTSAESVNDPNLHVNYQAYALCGLVALYEATGDKTLLQEIRKHYSAFIQRFKDASNGGFFDAYNVSTHQLTRTKSFNSTVYVATSFLLALRNADKGNEKFYDPVLFELADLVSTKFVDPQLKWINENFSENWKVAWRDWQARSVAKENGGKADITIGVGGHNTQASWFLMRVAEFAPEGQRQKFQHAATDILEGVLSKVGPRRVQANDDAATQVMNTTIGPILYDAQFGGFHDVFQRETDTLMWHTNKPWWQQAEAMLALSYAFKTKTLDATKWRPVLDQTVDFYFRSFIDIAGGGEFPEVSREGNGLGGAKGQAGKSCYHTVELARHMIDYLAL